MGAALGPQTMGSALRPQNTLIDQTKAATDPKNWIRDPAGSDPDPDPDPLTHGTFFHWPKIPQNVPFLAPFVLQLKKQNKFSQKQLRNRF